MFRPGLFGTATMHSNVSIEIINCEVCRDGGDSHYRFLVDKSVKYITLEGNLFKWEDMAFGPVIIPLLPSFPPGDWNEGHISRNPASGKPFFSSIERVSLPGVSSLWHPVSIEFLELEYIKRPRSNVCKVANSPFNVPTIAKFARFDWEISYFEAETAAYQLVADQGICPQFLGHLTEHGRCIGFLIEEITNSRHPGIDDLPICQEALKRLHAMGLKHGDTNKHNFLIQDERVFMIDIESTERCDDAEALQTELDTLGSQLADNSGRGGIVTSSWMP